MILKSIVARRFRGIKTEKPIIFSPGLNIVKGNDNEAGKSSLRLAITKALFQDPTTTREDIHKLISWGTDEPWEIQLDVQSGTSQYQLSKSLKDRTCRLVCVGSPEHPITNKAAIANRITELTGCPSEVFFESTACVAQDELIRIIPSHAEPSEKKSAFGTLTQRLQATLSGAQETDVPNIITKLYNKTHRKEARGSHSHLQRIIERMKALNEVKRELEQKVQSVMGSRKELNQIKTRLEQLSKELPPKQDLLNNNRRILELQSNINRDTTQYNNFSRAKGFKDKLDIVDTQLQSSCFFGKETDIKQLDQSKADLQELEEQKTVKQNEILQSVERQKPFLWTLIVGLVLMIGGVVLGIVSKSYLYFGLGIAVVGLVFLAYYLFQFQMASRKHRGFTSGELGKLEEMITSKNELVNSLLNSLGFSDYNKYKAQLKEYEEKLADRKQLYDRLSGMLGDQDWEAFKANNSGLAIKVEANQEELNKLTPFKLEPLEFQRLETEINGPEGLKWQISKLESTKIGLDHFLNYTDAETDQLASVEEELEWLKREQAFWERKQRIFEVTRQVLEDAHKQTLSRAASVLEKELGRYISIITDGRYKQVKIDETDLSIQTFSPEKKGWVNVLELSRATQDQFYICARFALVNLITEEKKPPLLLDDPFVNFHPMRLKRTIPLLQELAKENQIILFTCSDAYDSYGNTILLEQQ